MKTFLVNLDRKRDRLDFMDAALRRRGLEYERVPAVDGRALSPGERRRRFAAFRSFLLVGRKLTDGEIGCALSHAGICRRMVEEKIPLALVLEDDVILGDRFETCLEKVAACADVSKPQVYFLSCGNPAAPRDGAVRIVPSASGMTDGYVITLPAARIVLRANDPAAAVADYWPYWQRHFGLAAYNVFPVTVRQDNERFSSDVDPSYLGDAKKARRRAMLMRPLKLCGIAIDLVRYRLRKGGA